ncbi:MAG: hypothetical protein JW967_05560 [Dehalococcoidales bacterium]|nr:hypothetical protein [Dehalococcoidales bacterium]
MENAIKIELVPNLEHCIETVARKKHAELTKMLLVSEMVEPETEERLLTLGLFLNKADFKKLRAESEKHLARGDEVRFIIYLNKGVPRWEMHVT